MGSPLGVLNIDWVTPVTPTSSKRLLEAIVLPMLISQLKDSPAPHRCWIQVPAIGNFTTTRDCTVRKTICRKIARYLLLVMPCLD